MKQKRKKKGEEEKEDTRTDRGELLITLNLSNMLLAVITRAVTVTIMINMIFMIMMTTMIMMILVLKNIITVKLKRNEDDEDGKTIITSIPLPDLQI